MIYKVATMMAMFGAAAAEHWAVIVAGSAGYGNYRHQADACHAYQVVTAGGIKPENVILLAVDDIANYRTNPFPGQVFNKPTDAGTPTLSAAASPFMPGIKPDQAIAQHSFNPPLAKPRK